MGGLLDGGPLRILAGEPQGAGTPHGSRTRFGGSDVYFGPGSSLLGRPGRIFQPRLKCERGYPDRQAAEGSDEAENLQDHPDKIQQYAIHRGHPLPFI